MIIKLTNSTDLTKAMTKIRILKKVLAFPGQDLKKTIEEHIYTLEQKVFLLKKYGPKRDYKTIMKNLKMFEKRETDEIERSLLKKFPGKDIDTIMKDFADSLKS